MDKNSSSAQRASILADEDDELIKNEDQRALLEAENGLQQFDAVLKIAEEAILRSSFLLVPDTVCHLNKLAVQNIRRSAGQFRTIPIGISNTVHEPPPTRRGGATYARDVCLYK